MFEPAGGLSKNASILVWLGYVISTLLLFIVGIVSLVYFNEPNPHYPHFLITIGHWPLRTSMHPHSTLIVIIISVIICASFFLLASMFLRGLVIKDESYYHALYGKYTKFTPVALLVFVGMLMFCLCADWNDIDTGALVVGLIFTIIVCGALVFIYMNTSFGTNPFGFVVKKVFFSGIIVFTFFYFWYVICQMVEWHHGQYYTYSYYTDTKKTLSIIFQVVFGVCIGLAVWFIVDICGGIFGALIFIGILANMCRFEEKRGRYKGDCACSGIFMILLLSEVIAVSILKKDKVLAS